MKVFWKNTIKIIMLEGREQETYFRWEKNPNFKIITPESASGEIQDN